MAMNPVRAVYAAASSGAQTAITIDWRPDISSVVCEFEFGSGASGSVTIESTVDNINDTSITPLWWAETAAITANSRLVIGHPVQFVRLNISSLTGGTGTFKVLEGSPNGDVTGVSVPGGSSGGPTSNVNVAQWGGTATSLGIKARAASVPVVIADINSGEYETVAASQTAQVLGATGATGDYLSGLLVIPATTSPGNVLLLDNATSITVFTGGASSVSTLIPFFIPMGTYSVSGAWKVTTGTNVSVIGIGNFT